MIAYSYVRWSSDPQTKGDSLRRQERLAEQVCTEKGWNLNPIRRDEGVSGWDGSNLSSGALGEFLQAVKVGRIPTPCVLIIESFDRLSRLPTMQAFDLLREMLSLGVTIYTAADRMEYSQTSMESLGPLLNSLILINGAHQFSQTLSRRLRSSWSGKKTNAQSGGVIMTRKVPAWINVPEKARSTSEFRINEERANVVRRIFREYLSGKGVNSIALDLTKDGIKPFGRAKVWNVSTVNRWLRSKTVIGHFQSCTYLKRNVRQEDGLLIEGYYPAIVSEEDFYAAHQLRTKRLIPRGPKRHRHNLFSGLLFCKRCENGMAMKTGAVSKKRNSPYRAVVCSNAMRGGKCKYGKVPYVHFEEIVLQIMFAKMLGSMDSFENTAEAKLRKIDGELQDVEGRLKAFEKTLLESAPSEWPVTMNKVMRQLEKRRDELNNAKKLVPEDFGERRLLELVRNWQPIENNEENRSKVAHLLSGLIERINIDAIAQEAEILLRSRSGDTTNLVRWDRNNKTNFFLNGTRLPKGRSQVWLQPDRIIDASKLRKLPSKTIYTEEVAYEYRVSLKIGKSLRPFRCLHTTQGCEYLEVLTPEEAEKGKAARRFGDPSPVIKIEGANI